MGKHYSQLLEGVGFTRGECCGVVFYHEERDIALAVHGDDFTFCADEEDLWWIRDLMASWFEIKVRATLGEDSYDDKEVMILGRIVKWKEGGLEYEADPRHRSEVMKYFGFEEDSRALTVNGDKDIKEEEGDEEELIKTEGTVFRGLAARFNFMS